MQNFRDGTPIRIGEFKNPYFLSICIYHGRLSLTVILHTHLKLVGSIIMIFYITSNLLVYLVMNYDGNFTVKLLQSEVRLFIIYGNTYIAMWHIIIFCGDTCHLRCHLNNGISSVTSVLLCIT